MLCGDTMNRNHIEKIAQTPEDRMLLAKIWDKIQAGMRKNILSCSPFLTPRELEMCRYLFGQNEELVTFGGYEDAERRMLVYLPEYLDKEAPLEDDSPIVCLHADFYEGDSLTHRDFLGALMGAGIARETVGDILIDGNQCDFLVTAQIAPYILQNLTGAGRTKLHISKKSLRDIHVPQQQVKQIRDTLASLRLDSVVASGFRIGRSLATQYITAGKVAIDGLPCEKPDRTVPEGAKISLRGSGKIQLSSIGGKSKKDRICVIIHRYL